MPLGPSYRPDPLFAALGDEFSDAVEPADFPQHIVRWRDQRAAAEVGLVGLTEAEWVDHLGRFDPLPGQPGPRAMRYHGHQFRHYNPDLGDGRGFLAAQLRDDRGRLLDLGTKGSGQTPFSRDGDGRLTLKGGVREVLAAEMLAARGVPTCRILSLIETGEQLARGDEPSPTRSAVMVRLSHTHVRFGTFQRHAFFQRTDLIERLVAHVIEAYHPAATDAASMLEAVVRAQARLVARWTAAGFEHGVPSWLSVQALRLSGGRPGVLVMILSMLASGSGMAASSISAVAGSALPLTTAMTSGPPISSRQASTIIPRVSGVNSEGFITTLAPAIRAGIASPSERIRGKFQGLIRPTTGYGVYRTRSFRLKVTSEWGRTFSSPIHRSAREP